MMRARMLHSDEKFCSTWRISSHRRHVDEDEDEYLESLQGETGEDLISLIHNP